MAKKKKRETEENTITVTPAEELFSKEELEEENREERDPEAKEGEVGSESVTMVGELSGEAESVTAIGGLSGEKENVTADAELSGEEESATVVGELSDEKEREAAEKETAETDKQQEEERKEQENNVQQEEELKEQDIRLRRKKRRKATIAFAVMIILLAGLFFAALNIGSLQVTVKELFRGLFVEYNEDVATIADLRFPRIFISMLAGAAVSVSGVLFQAVLKNPLADPGIIGISSGASFVAVIVTAYVPLLYNYTPVFAFFGGIFAFVLVYSLSWKGDLSPLRIILVGVAVDAMFTGLSNAINSMSGSSSSVASIVEGNITMKTWDDVVTLLPYVAVGLVLSLLFCGRCNLLALEDKTARSLGVNVNRSRILISIVAVLLASISTAVAGAISFLGLIVPHIGRLLVGSDHKSLVPFSMLLGAFTFLLADTIGRTIAYPYEISASIIMSVVGGPFFIILLRRSKKYANS